MLNPKSLLKVLSVVLLSFGQVVGMVGVARSTIMAQQQDAAIPSIDDLIQVLKTGSEGERLEAGEILGQMGQTNPAVIPAKIPICLPAGPYPMPSPRWANPPDRPFHICSHCSKTHHPTFAGVQSRHWA
jgi:hypothetical protein